MYSVQEGSKGAEGGLQVNDILVSINGEENKNINDYLAVIKSSPNKPLSLVVKRNNETMNLTIVPQAIEKRNFDVDFLIVSNLPFIDNLHYALNETIYYLRANVIGLGQLLTGNTENVEVQGIVGISQQISSTERAVEFFYMMSAISLSLGIMNLLPVPGLDGGKIVFTLIEMIRRKPISREVEGTLTLAGFGVLILLMIVVTVSDVANLF